MINSLNKLSNYKELFLKSAEKYGTPQYIFAEDILIKRIAEIKNSFADNADIFYSYKTNCVPYICNIMHQNAIHAEVSSILELQLALHLNAKKVSFDSPAKTEEAIKLAIDNNNKVTVSTDSINELKKISKITRAEKKPLRIMLRLNIHDKKNKWSKFGFTPEEFEKALKIIDNEEYIDLYGLHFHTGTEIKGSKKFKNSIKKIREIILHINNPSRIKCINLGGGFAAGGYKKIGLIYSILKKKYRKKFSNTKIEESIKDVAKDIINEFNESIRSIKGLNDVDMWIEPGRWLINPTIFLLAKIIDAKSNNRSLLDLSLTQAKNLSWEFHEIFNLNNLNSKVNKTRFIDSHPDSLEIYSNHYYGSKFKIGDILCVSDLGAYSLPNLNQFCKPLPRLIGLSKTGLKEIRKEEDFNYRYLRDGIKLKDSK